MKISKKVILFIFVTTILVLSSNAISSQSPELIIQPSTLNSENAISKEIKQGLVSPGELEAWLETLIQAQLSYYSIYGATVSVVKDSGIYFTKGYGYRNASLLLPVIPDQTIFRVGSISKTFTAISILQLVEDGLLDLDTDVNDYLTAFKIPENFDDPITIKHLLTHTAGFEELALTVVFPVEDIGITLEELLADYMPDRVKPPGFIQSYSNYGFALLGYLVEITTGKDFSTYTQDEIFNPLGMNSSTFEQPLPSHLEGNMSGGYWEDKSPGYFEYINVVGAGAMSSTATDIARFMIAMMNNTSIDGNQILNNDTVSMMIAEQFTNHEELPGICFGLYEMDFNDQHIIGHGGDTLFFHSRMFMLPDSNLGFFLSYNGRYGSYAKGEVFDLFMNRYFPFSGVTIEPLKGYKSRVNRFTGMYISTRRTYSNKLMIAEIDWIINAIYLLTDNGYLYIRGISGLMFVEVEPNFFREATGIYDYSIAFIENEKGKISHIVGDIFFAVSALEKGHPLHSQASFNMYVLIGLAGLVFLSTISWGIDGIFRHSKKKKKTPLVQRLARWTSFGAFTLSVLATSLAYWKAETDIMLDTQTGSELNGILILPALFLFFIVGQIMFNYTSWTGKWNIEDKPYWKIFGRIQYTIITLVFFVFVGYFVSWHFYGF